MNTHLDMTSIIFINPMCCCGTDIETIHYLQPCQHSSVQLVDLLNDMCELYSALQNSSKNQLLTVLSYGSQKITLNVNEKNYK